MPKPRTKLKLTEEERKAWRREQKKRSMRQQRAKLDAAAIDERRQKDRERYQRKKESGLISSIHDFTSTEQQQIRKAWREKTKNRREKQKLKKWAENILQENAPSSSGSSTSKTAIAAQTKLVIDALKAQNTLVSLVTKRKSPCPVSSREPVLTGSSSVVTVSVNKASSPAPSTESDEIGL